jgi:hypothetical protein
LLPPCLDFRGSIGWEDYRNLSPTLQNGKVDEIVRVSLKVRLLKFFRKVDGKY